MSLTPGAGPQPARQGRGLVGQGDRDPAVGGEMGIVRKQRPGVGLACHRGEARMGKSIVKETEAGPRFRVP